MTISTKLDTPNLSVADAAEALSVRERYIYDAVASGRLPAYRVGRLLRFKGADLEAFAQPVGR